LHSRNRMNRHRYSRTGIFSRGIAKLHHLEAFVPETEAMIDLSGLPGLFSGRARSIDSVAGWGLKPTAARARGIAARRGLPYLALEDGFLRSVGLGVQGALPLSLVVDDVGIYYDGSQPSRLETLIEEGVFTQRPELEDRAASALAEFKERGLSKYNCGQNVDLASLGVPQGRRVLVVDQCQGDASVQLGLAGQEQFLSMLNAARNEHPGAHILIKTHPDVLAGKRQGYLEQAFSDRDVTVLSQNIEPGCLFEQVEAVFTVSSLLGLEALIAGKTVRCFGLPFYAGWGVTVDALTCPRRQKRCSVLEIFAAAYMLYPRYVDPYTGTRSNLEATMERIAFLKQDYAKRPHQVHCFGVPRWKRSHVRPFLSRPGGRVSFHASQHKALHKAAEEGGEVIVWAAKESPGLQKEADAAGLPLSRLEDGFIRSCGLGSDLIAASSLILDRSGVHFNHTRPSDVETILNETVFHEHQLERARSVRGFIHKHGISKYNSEFQTVDSGSWPGDRPRILVTGQVDDDAAVRQGTEGVRSNRELLETVRQENPEAFVIYKIHPDVASGNRRSSLSSRKAEELADAVITGVSLDELFPRVDEVHVLTSLAGFEALMAGKTVVTYGGPFYAGWGLTRDRLSFPGRTRLLSLDELLAGSLLIYPMYHDWQTGLPCSLETTLDRLMEQREKVRRTSRAFAVQQTGKGWHWVSRIINGTAGLAGVVRR